MDIRHSFVRAVTAAMVLSVLALGATAAAQGGFIAGKVTRDNGDPMGGATVMVEELKRETRTGADGTYRFDNVPPGTYHVVGARRGLQHAAHGGDRHAPGRDARSRRRARSALRGDRLGEPQLRGRNSSRISRRRCWPDRSCRNRLEADPRRDAAVRARRGDALARARSGASGDSRPRRRSRRRARRTASASAICRASRAITACTVNPASAQADRSRARPGDAALRRRTRLAGSSTSSPTRSRRGRSPARPATFTLDLGIERARSRRRRRSARRQRPRGAHLGGNGRRTGNFSTPDGEVENSQAAPGRVQRRRVRRRASKQLRRRQLRLRRLEVRRADRRGGADAAHAAAACVHDPRRRAGPRRRRSPRIARRSASSATTTTSSTATRSRRTSTTTPRKATCWCRTGRRPAVGTVGGSFLNRRFNTEGEEALSPPVDQRGGAFFLYEELTWPHVTLQFGGRGDHTSFSPDGGLPERSFNEFSGSVGLLLRPAAANDKFVIALSLARAARNPALEELYFFGAHPGNFAFEIGNPDLGAERGFGLDVSLRGRAERVHGELTFFRNDINDFIFRNPLDDEEVLARTRVQRALRDERRRSTRSFPVIEYVGADSVLGRRSARRRRAHAGARRRARLDLVRGELNDTGEPLPRIPPFRVIPGPALSEERAAVRRQRHACRRSEPCVRRRDADRGLRAAEAVRLVFVRGRRRRPTRSPRGSTTRPTSCIAIT